MKTKVEINGYEIEIEEKDGLVSVSATKDGEIIEEFSLNIGEGQEESEEDKEEVQSFDEFGQEEEEDFEGEEVPEEEESEEEEEDFEGEEESEEEEEGKLESFQSFISKRK